MVKAFVRLMYSCYVVDGGEEGNTNDECASFHVVESVPNSSSVNLYVYNLYDCFSDETSCNLTCKKDILSKALSGAELRRKELLEGIASILSKIVEGFKIPLHSINFYSTQSTYFPDGEDYEFDKMYVGYRLNPTSTDLEDNEDSFEYDEDMEVIWDKSKGYQLGIFF